jgi:hypothetical protein
LSGQETKQSADNRCNDEIRREKCAYINEIGLASPDYGVYSLVGYILPGEVIYVTFQLRIVEPFIGVNAWIWDAVSMIGIGSEHMHIKLLTYGLAKGHNGTDRAAGFESWMKPVEQEQDSSSFHH